MTTKVTGMMQTSTKGGDISSASPCVIDTDGDYFDVTGTTNFAAFTVAAGRRFTIQFDGALTMTHHATNLDLPGGANITTAAGDVAEFFATGTNTVQCVNYTKADGTAMVAGASAPSHRNDIINGGYLVNQENATAAADDAYSIGDLFLHVGEAAVTTSLQTSGGPQGDRKFARINIDTANKQSGWVYFLSNADCQDYIANGKMSFGIKIKTTSAAIDTVRIGLLKWTGTADSVTSDVVATWAQDGTNPTLATSWSYENTPADVNLTTSWVRHTVEDVTVDSDTNNLACFVWIDDGTIAEDDQFDVSEWQLNPGSTVNDFSTPSIAAVLDQVAYYVEQLVSSAVVGQYLGSGYAWNADNQTYPLYYRAKRTIPSGTISAAASWQITNRATSTDCASVAISGFGISNATFTTVGSSTINAFDPVLLRAKTTAASILLDARH